jgi:hypothetical protein
MNDLNLTKYAKEEIFSLTKKMDYEKLEQFTNELKIEADKILNDEHQYITLADVIRVFNSLK